MLLGSVDFVSTKTGFAEIFCTPYTTGMNFAESSNARFASLSTSTSTS